ncbi:MAG TPA: hypothetical protein VJ865_15480 [Gemmatimonadaceae bacterium]|nr:hypothetical protein [Gemmatimonadaceae bacterium]
MTTQGRASNSGAGALSAYASGGPQTQSGFRFAVLALRSRWQILGTALFAAVLTSTILLALPKKYVTTVSFIPVASPLASMAAAGLGGLASQLGVSLPGADPSLSPDFYANLLSTPDVQRPLVETPHVVRTGADTVRGSFIQLYDINKGDSGKTIAEALRVLSGRVMRVSFDRQTSVVQVSITTKWRDLSFQMAQQVLTLVNEFNLNRHQQQNAEQQRFLGERVAVAQTELRAAESTLENFLLRNRSYQNDPSLLFAHDRLQQEVTLRQNVYMMLLQGFEQARVEAVRTTPSISVVEQPRLALRFERRGILFKAVFAFIIGTLVAYLLVLLRASIDEARANRDPAAEMLGRLVQELRKDVMRALPLSRRSPAA